MITPSFSLTATERILPKLALDFTTASLDSRITFSRTTDATHPATYINSSGYVASATDNQARFDYNPVTLVCKGLLIEESRQNLMTYTESFITTWFAGNASITGNAAVGPSGTQIATKLYEDSASNYHLIHQSFATTVQSYTYSVYAKAAGRNRFTMRNDAYTGSGSTFDLSTGSVVANQGTGVGSITALGNSWYRCVVTLTGAAATDSYGIYLNTDAGSGAQSYQGDGASGIYIWGVQFEAGAFETSYIPNTGNTKYTRNADVATITGTNFSNWWTTTTGSVNVSIIPKSISGIKPLFQMDDGTVNNIISLRGNVANPELYIKATTDQVQIDAGTIVANTAYKLAGAWNTDNCAAAQNGAAAVTDTSATIPVVTQARIGSDGTNYANGWLQKINYWPQRITDNETQAFSK